MEVTLSVNFPKGKCCDGSLEPVKDGFGMIQGLTPKGFCPFLKHNNYCLYLKIKEGRDHWLEGNTKGRVMKSEDCPAKKMK